MPYDSLKFIALAGYAPNLSDPADLDAKTVLAMRDLLQKTAAEVIADIDAAYGDPDLSKQGKASKAARIAGDGINRIRNMTGLEASRKALEARLAASPVPGLDSIPAPLMAPLLASLQTVDPMLVVPKAIGYLEAGDAYPAVLILNLPASLALASEADKAALALAVRMKANGAAARAAIDMATAIEFTTAAMDASIEMIRSAADLPDIRQPIAT